MTQSGRFSALALVFSGLGGILTVGGLGGCATYVNVPGESEDFAAHSVNTYPTPTIMANAIDHVVSHYPPIDQGHPVSISIPPGANADTLSRVRKVLPENAILESEIEADEKTQYRVMSVYKRGTRASANVLVPESSTGRFVIEVAMRFNVDGWRITGTRRWFPGDVPAGDIQAIDVNLGPAPSYSNREVPEWNPPPLPEWGTGGSGDTDGGRSQGMGAEGGGADGQGAGNPPAQEPQEEPEEPPK